MLEEHEKDLSNEYQLIFKTVDAVQTAVTQYVFLITLPTSPPPPRSLYLLPKGQKNKIKSLYGIFYPCSKFPEN